MTLCLHKGGKFNLQYFSIKCETRWASTYEFSAHRGGSALNYVLPVLKRDMKSERTSNQAREKKNSLFVLMLNAYFPLQCSTHFLSRSPSLAHTQHLRKHINNTQNSQSSEHEKKNHINTLRMIHTIAARSRVRKYMSATIWYALRIWRRNFYLQRTKISNFKGSNFLCRYCNASPKITTISQCFVSRRLLLLLFSFTFFFYYFFCSQDLQRNE